MVEVPFQAHSFLQYAPSTATSPPFDRWAELDFTRVEQSQRNSADDLSISFAPRGTQNFENPFATPVSSQEDLGSYVAKMDVKPRYDPEEELRLSGKSNVSRQKRDLIIALIAVKYVLSLRYNFIRVTNNSAFCLSSRHGGGHDFTTYSSHSLP